MADPVEVPSLSVPEFLRKSAAPEDRPGWYFLVPGECLKSDSKMWTPEQRAHGVYVRMVFPTSSDEENSIAAAQQAGKLAALGIFAQKMSLAALSDVAFDEAGKPKPAGWAPIPHLHKPSVWEELGGQGRMLCANAYHMATQPTEEARAAMAASFCVQV